MARDPVIVRVEQAGPIDMFFRVTSRTRRRARQKPFGPDGASDCFIEAAHDRETE